MSPLDHPLLNVVVLLAAIVGNSCFFYVATRVGPLPFLFILLANAAISAPLLLLLCLLQARTAASRQPLLGGEAGRGQTEESLAAMRCLGISRSPRRHATIFLLALLSAGSGVLLVQGGRHTAAALHSLLYQLLIPFNLLFTAALLRRLPARVEFCGALTVCAGVVLALWPLLRSADGYADNSPMGNLLYALGVVPASLHAVLSERVLKAWDLERTHGGPGVLPLAFFVALWALPITLCCVPACAVGRPHAAPRPSRTRPFLVWQHPRNPAGTASPTSRRSAVCSTRAAAASSAPWPAARPRRPPSWARCSPTR
jgi:drug/metabolite transporter (DMT)-like permease